MKKNFCAPWLIFFFLQVSYQIQSQEIATDRIASKYSYAEKIYLQLSNSSYTTNNTIWFKAIVTDFVHLPTKTSGVLRVELIDFDKRIIDQKLLKIEYGIADGFFDLKEDLPPGRYMIRAYTDWNKNFEKEFISQIYIDVYAPKKVFKNEDPIRNVTLTETASKQFELSAKVYPNLLNPKYRGDLKMDIHTGSKTVSVAIKKDKDDGYSFQYLLPKEVIKARLELKLDTVKVKNNKIPSYSKTVVVDDHYLDLQFFPEGGKLVDGLTSIIGIKALNYNNKGKELTGYIVDQDDNIIVPFRTNTLGMGATYLTPSADKKYYGTIKNKAGIEFKYELPQVNQKGVVLKVKELHEYIVINISTTHSNHDMFHVQVQARGFIYKKGTLPLKKGVAHAVFEKRELPEGILHFKVLNKQDQTVCERLFFNFREDERINITVSPHLKYYSQRDKTVLNLATTDKNNKAIQANLSVLVVNKEQLGSINDTRNNILSYFLLHSELRGTIEKPSYYFNPENKSRKYDIDALLLTQGWRNYKYENSPSTIDFEIFPETSLSVLGTVRNLLRPKKPLRKPIEVTLMYGPLNVITQQVDSTGRFNFQIEDFYKENFKVVIQTKTKKEKKKSFIIDLEPYQKPKIDYLREENIQLLNTISAYGTTKSVSNQVEEDFKVAEGTIALDEVKLSGYKITPARQKMMDLHGPPDFVIENTELRTQAEKWHTGLYSLLQSKYPNEIDVSPYPLENPEYLKAEVIGREVTLVIVDGIPVRSHEYPFLEDLPIEEIKSFEILKRPESSRYYLGNVFRTTLDDNEEFISFAEPTFNSRIGFICIYTYAGKGFYGTRSTKGVRRGFVSGFAPKIEFYAPKYGTNDINDWTVPDLRSVVHWAPNIDTDAKGNAKVGFYNADKTGEMLVIVEGFTENGALGYYETTYTVDEKLEK